MVPKIIVAILATTLLLSCNPAQLTGELIPSGSEPILMSITPAAAHAGDDVTIKGVGFSLVAAENIVLIDGSSVAATSYNLTGDDDSPESIVFTVPASLSPGDFTIQVMVAENVSNEINITLNP